MVVDQVGKNFGEKKIAKNFWPSGQFWRRACGGKNRENRENRDKSL